MKSLFVKSESCLNTTILDLFVIWIKFHNELGWYRLFLDAGLCFLEKYNLYEVTYLEDIEGHVVYHLCDRYQLQDLTIISATVEVFNTSGVKLTIILDNKLKIVFWCNNIDTKSSLFVDASRVY